MSQWTHISGMIRVDSLVDIFDKTVRVESQLQRIIQNSYVPSGSEGPIMWSVENTREGNSLSWGHIAIWGDLRDFGEEDVNSIKVWWNKLHHLFSHSNYIIRDSVLKIEPEGGLHTILLQPIEGESNGKA